MLEKVVVRECIIIVVVDERHVSPSSGIGFRITNAFHTL